MGSVGTGAEKAVVAREGYADIKGMSNVDAEGAGKSIQCVADTKCMGTWPWR